MTEINSVRSLEYRKLKCFQTLFQMYYVKWYISQSAVKFSTNVNTDMEKETKV